jgi:DNA end-binding protein Ku
MPVEVQTASKENPLPLHMLDSRDFAPVRYHRVNKNTGKEVDWSHIVKGYELRQALEATKKVAVHESADL